MPVQTHGGHEDQVGYVDDTEDKHRLPRCEFRSHFLGEVECKQEGDDGREEEPLGHRITEEKEADQLRWVPGPVGDDEAEQQTGVLRNEIVADLAD